MVQRPPEPTTRGGGSAPVLGGTLALDLGSRTGWASRDSRGEITSGEWRFKPSATVHPGAVFCEFDAFLRALIHRVRPARILYEIPFHNAPGRRAALVLLGMEAIVSLVAYETRTNLRGLNASTVKKLVTGKGNATKDEVAFALRIRGRIRADAGPNEADAVAVLFADAMRERQEINIPEPPRESGPRGS